MTASTKVVNRLDLHLENDPRERALRDAVYRAVARGTAGSGVPELAASEAPPG